MSTSIPRQQFHGIPVPPHYRPVLDPEAMQKRIQELGEQIAPWAESVQKSTGQQLLALCILRGGAIFYSDLIRSIPVTVEQAFCRARSYVDNAQTGRGVHLEIYDAPIKGRAVLVVDDICDTGATLSAVRAELSKLGAAEVREATLLYRKLPDANYRPAWVAATFDGPEWLVGSGLEDRNTNSNMPGVYCIEGTGI